MLPIRPFLTVAIALFFAPWAAWGTALDDYIAAPDASYTYTQVNSSSVFPLTTAYTLDLTSQTWRSVSEVSPTVWKHWVIVYKPYFNFLLTSDTALLFIDGGNTTSPAPAYDDQFRDLAVGTGSVIVVLTGVPNQPLQFTDEATPRSEDAIIAYSWDKYLDGGDSNWPVQLPMVKSVVRCMDAVQDHIQNVAGKSINHFVLAGGSKRGWTAWLTGAVDNRVSALAPIVSDLLNMKRSFAHHWAAYGAWSDALSPYEVGGIFDRFDDPRATTLLDIVDPLAYADRLSMPKFIVNAAGDEFFVPDSIRFYYNNLIGETYLRHVPNTNHYLDGAFEDVLFSMVPYYKAFLDGDSRPEFSWSLEPDGAIRVQTVDTPQEVRLWMASNTTARDFRLITIGAAWQSFPLFDTGGGVYIGQVAEPTQGWTAFFVELVFDGPSLAGTQFDFTFSTEMRVLPETLPFETDFNRDRATDVLDLQILAELWLTDNAYRDIAPRMGGDGIIHLPDFYLFNAHWPIAP